MSYTKEPPVSNRAGGTGPWQSHCMISAHAYPFEIRLRRTGTAQMGLGVPKWEVNSLSVCVVRGWDSSTSGFALEDGRYLLSRTNYVHFSPTLHSVMSSWYLDTDQHGSIFHYGNWQTLQIRNVYFFNIFSFSCSDIDIPLNLLALSSVISNLLLIP